MKKTFVYAAILLVVSMVSGVAVGAAIERTKDTDVAEVSKESSGEKKSVPRLAMRARKKALGNLAKRLKLNEEQKETLRNILEASREEITSLKKEYHTQLFAVRKDTHTKIKTILTPEQQEKFEKIISKHRKHLKEDRKIKDA